MVRVWVRQSMLLVITSAVVSWHWLIVSHVVNLSTIFIFTIVLRALIIIRNLTWIWTRNINFFPLLTAFWLFWIAAAQKVIFLDVLLDLYLRWVLFVLWKQHLVTAQTLLYRRRLNPNLLFSIPISGLLIFYTPLDNYPRRCDTTRNLLINYSNFFFLHFSFVNRSVRWGKLSEGTFGFDWISR